MRDAVTIPTRRDWAILCDFDGTIALEDVFDTLLARFARPGWEVLERQWRDGRIGSRECMRGQVALMDMNADALAAHIQGCRIDPDFPAFAALAAKLGVPLRVVSDGLDQVIHAILDRHGLGHLPVAANHLQAVGTGGWELHSPFQAGTCDSGTCKCACREPERSRTLLIGDGASDFCIAGKADFVFAKGRLRDHCGDAGIPHRAIDGFADALALLPRLVDDELVRDAVTLPLAAQS